MTGFLGAAYPWVKAAHLIFVIFWIAGLFMLPRFYIYHQEAAKGSDEDKRWIAREDKLRRIILLPSIGLVWLLGLVLAFNIEAFSQGWFQAKLVAVIALSAFHGWAVGYGKRLAAGERRAGDKQLRIMNEIPGVAVAVIVILVIVKPF